MPLVPKITGANLALIAVFAALIVVLTLPPEVTLAAGVPLSLQTLGVVLAGLVLGAWRGAAAVALYVLIGLAGLPVYSNGSSGWAVFTGATGGYIWAFTPAAFVVGWLAERIRARQTGAIPYVAALGAGIVSMPIIYAVGVPWLARVLDVPVLNPVEEGGPTALAWGMLPFIVGDLVKVAIAAAVAVTVHRAFPHLLSSQGGSFASRPAPAAIPAAKKPAAKKA